MDKTTFQNPDNRYREYSDQDIERIWFYRLLQGIGYSLNEIVEMIQTADFDFYASISEKIIDLERKKYEIEQHIGFAKVLKLTGCFPYPKEMGSMRFDDFIKYARESWNVNTDPQMASVQELAETFLNKSEWTEKELQQLVATLMDNFDYDIDVEALLILNDYYDNLIRHKELGISHPVVQALANLIYRHYCENLFPAEVVENMTPQKFTRYTVRQFTVGDFALIQERTYGKDGCKFIAEVLAHFGGYSSLEDID